MCGIFGQILLTASAVPEKKRVASGTRLMAHRGPDGEGLASAKRFEFGHRRLAIIDRKLGHQPMWSENKRSCITFNGEVYNFQEIRTELEGVGVGFSTRSDTEVVLKAFEHWGIESLSRFRGMFAFAAVDQEKGTALIARDRLGVKPLFYTVTRDSLFFSSELEPLFKTVGPFQLDLEALDEYLGWQYVHAPRTIYRNVYCLLPGHSLAVDLKTGSIECRPYWELRFSEDETLSMDDWEEKLDTMLREAIKLRLISEVPFGAFLSGGVDSSLVVAYMSEILERPVKTFTIGFQNADFDETPFAAEAASLRKTEHFVEVVEPDSFGLLPSLVRHFGQPFADSSAIPTFYVSRLGRRHVTMILSGDGGDENFAGYNSYEWILKRLPVSDVSDSRVGARGWLRSILSAWAQVKTLSVEPSTEQVDQAFQLHCQTAKHFPPAERCDLYLPKWQKLIREFPACRREAMDLTGQPIISRLQHLDLKNYLPFDILTKVDVTAMANSLEVRTPLLDHRLVEMAAKIPARYKLRKKSTAMGSEIEKKILLKRLAQRWFPSSLIHRPKMGFGVPMGYWLAGPLREEMEQRLLRSEVMNVFFQPEKLSRLVLSHSMSHNVGTRLWNLLVLEEWLRTHPETLVGIG